MTTIKERPILFSAPMVRAIMDDRKTQTRRVVKEKHLPFIEDMTNRLLDGDWEKRPMPHGKPGDRLWVRETIGYRDEQAKRERDTAHIFYRADNPKDYDSDGVWTPSIFMPRWASRITLEITDVRVERLNDISEEDARAEGFEAGEKLTAEEVMEIPPGEDRELARLLVGGRPSAKLEFAMLWSDINGAKSWDANPWVWCISFRRVGQ